MKSSKNAAEKKTWKWSMCKCEVRGLVRPEGPIKIAKTDMKTSDVLVAKLSGAVNAKVASVRANGKYYVVAPKKYGGVREVPADSLTDGLHAAVWSMAQELKSGKLLSEGQKLSREKQLKEIKKLKVADKVSLEKTARKQNV